ncbi:hypothetical protein GCM10010321_88850 [Streptomyces chartreusis]|nr:hypothetical protein GCM10010321_88850 [Streptomyces chartreusis]
MIISGGRLPDVLPLNPDLLHLAKAPRCGHPRVNYGLNKARFPSVGTLSGSECGLGGQLEWRGDDTDTGLTARWKAGFRKPESVSMSMSRF